MGKTTDIRELRERAEGFAVMASYRKDVVWFWRNAGPSKEMIEIINHVDELLERIQSLSLPKDSVEVIRAGRKVHEFASKAIDISKDNDILNKMMRQFVDAIGDQDVQGGEPKDRGDDRGV